MDRIITKKRKMDRISGLPKYILHDILSRLPKKDCVRTSVLSKEWRETWSTFPILSICDEQFMERFVKLGKKCLRKRKLFLDCVKKTLLRFHDQGLAIKEFKLDLDNCDHPHMSQDIDLWMKLAIESGVEVLRLCLPAGFRQDVDHRYTFPLDVLEAKSLIRLELRGGFRLGQVVLNHSIKDFSLRVLHLHDVLLGDEGNIEHLISQCPLIEQIILRRCYVCNPVNRRCQQRLRTLQLKSSSLNGLQKLKGVDIHGIQDVYIDAPNLENLCCCSVNGSAPFKLNLDSCRNLRRLDLWSMNHTVITDKWLLELFSKFPFLESLKLNSCYMSERINIASAQLKVLELIYCSYLKEVNIDAPNLLSCGYYGKGSNIPVIYFLRCSSKLEINVTINMDFLNLYSLREVIQNFKPQKDLASLSLFIYKSDVAELIHDVLQISSPLPSVKHLNLHHMPRNEDLYLPLVYILLSSCCPETISFGLHSYSSEAFAEFLLEMLMGRNRDKCYCSSGPTKCWWHGLKNVKDTRSVNTFYLINTFDEMTDSYTAETVSFKLEL